MHIWGTMFFTMSSLIGYLNAKCFRGPGSNTQIVKTPIPYHLGNAWHIVGTERSSFTHSREEELIVEDSCVSCPQER